MKTIMIPSIYSTNMFMEEMISKQCLEKHGEGTKVFEKRDPALTKKNVKRIQVSYMKYHIYF